MPPERSRLRGAVVAGAGAATVVVLAPCALGPGAARIGAPPTAGAPAFLNPIIQSLFRVTSATGSEAKHGGKQGGDGDDSHITPQRVLGCMAIIGSVSGAAFAGYWKYSQRLHRPKVRRKSRIVGLERMTPLSRQVATLVRSGRRRITEGGALRFGSLTDSPFTTAKRPPEVLRVRTEPNLRTRAASESAVGNGNSGSHTTPRCKRMVPRMLTLADLSPPKQVSLPPNPGDHSISSIGSQHHPQTPLMPRLGQEDFYELFDTVDAEATGFIDYRGIQEVVELLNQEFSVGLLPDDAARLWAFLGGTKPGSESPGGLHEIGRDAFVEGLGTLFRVFIRVSQELTLGQLRIVVSAAFDRFDLNNDGQLSEDEFYTACGVLGLELSAHEAKTLHRFFVPAEGFYIQQETFVDSRPFWEKWGSALQGSFDQMRRRSGFDSATHLASQVLDALRAPGAPNERLQRAAHAANEGAEHMAATAELAVSTAGVAVAMQYIGDSIQDAQSLMSVDLGEIAPFLMLVGLSAVNLAKELDELTLKEMSEDEAQLYARVFHQLGFTQAQFRRLLNCGGFRWGQARPGEALNDAAAIQDNSLKIVVKGQVYLTDGTTRVPMRSGTMTGATHFLRGEHLWAPDSVRAASTVTYASWDAHQLRTLLKHDKELALRVDRLLANSMAANIRAEARLQEEVASAGILRGDNARPENPFPMLLPGVTPSDGATRSRTSSDGTVPAERARALGPEPSMPFDPLNEPRAALPNSEGSEGVLRQEELGLLIRFLSLTQGGAGAGAGADACREEARRLFGQADPNGAGAVPASLLPSFLKAAKAKDGATKRKDGNGFSAISSVLEQQAERKGLSRFCFFANQVQQVICSPGDPVLKARKALQTVWDGTEHVADFVEALTDATGACAALFGIWQEFQDAATPGVEDGLNLAPFLIFLGICGSQAAKHHAESDVSDLSDREVEVYTRVFQNEGFTVGEFRRLLRMGANGAQWQQLDEGERMRTAESEGKLRMLVRGRCQACCSRPGSRQQATPAAISVGAFFPERLLLGGDHSEDADVFEALEPSEMLVWDAGTLNHQLQHEETLRMKVHRLATLALADKLLSSRHAAGRMVRRDRIVTA